MKLPLAPILALLAAAVLPTPAGAKPAATTLQIERLTLDQMVAKTDNAVFGKIKSRNTFRVDHPIDGAELYFTTLRIDGRSLEDGRALSVEVTYPSGNPDKGTWNSEEPSADDVRVGNQVVAFYKWSDNMGGDVAANALYASHGGIYRTVQADAKAKPVVLGRGDGYAVGKNVQLEQLETSIRSLAKAKKEEPKKK